MFIDKLKGYQEGKGLPFTLEFDDPLDNCFIMNPNYPNKDEKVMVEIYKRTEEQEDDLGFKYLIEEENNKKALL